MRSIHCRSGMRTTGWPPRSLMPSMTSSLASTVPRAGHQLTGDFELISQALLVLIAAHGRFSPAAADLGRDRQLGDRAGPLSVAAIEPDIEQHQEDPLRPAEIVGVGRGQLRGPSRS